MQLQTPLFVILFICCHLVISQHVGNESLAKPQVYYLHVNSDIRSRYARTVVTSRIANPATASQEVTFSSILPETAFISAFTLEVDGKEYDAYVKEKEEAKQEYSEAVKHGWTAGHVALSARDSNRFTVSVNVEPQKKVTFKLTYEELLSRKLGFYKHVINLDPGQIVQDFGVDVNIQESTSIASVKVPALRISNEIDDDPEGGSHNPLAIIERPTPQSAVVKFHPTADQQKVLATDGIKGQLVVEYDVDRSSQPGEVLVRDGYFVHFFSPVDLSPLRKQVTFVLDVSGSMSGRKIEQLRQAMTTILEDLNKDDLFTIILFSDTAQVWDPALNSTELKERMNQLQDFYSWGYPLREHQEVAPKNQTLSPSVIAAANSDNIAKAKEFVGQLEALSSTNMYDALMKALEITKLGRELNENSEFNNDLNQQVPEPIIIFLTDGQPNRNKEIIVTDVTKSNIGKSSIFTLALGTDADFDFLKKLSLRNSGFARKIYEASDTALQLRDFYREVASPLLANISFKYQTQEDEPIYLTKRNFRRLFSGSELVVAGRLQTDVFSVQVEGSSSIGSAIYPFTPTICTLPPFPTESNITVSPMERMWAYLTIQQLLEEDEAKDYNREDKNQTSPEKQRALELALQYTFVTPLTSLIVVKPNETRSVETKDASLPQDDSDSYAPWSHNAPQPLMGLPGGALAKASYGGAAGYGSYMSAGAHGAFIARSAAASSGFQPQFFPPPPAPPAPIPPPSAAARGISTGIVNAVPVSLIPLNEVTWLTSVLRNNTVILPSYFNTSEHELQLAGPDQPNVQASACDSPAGAGECRHLRYCALDVFSSSISNYQPYFCSIQSYIGVCCQHFLGTLTSNDNSYVQIAQIPLGNLTWLKDSDTTLSLPDGSFGGTEILQLASLDEPNITHGTCMSPAGLGFCRHLRHCPIDYFSTDERLFYPQYFCRIPQNFVGVCCPLRLQW